LAPTADGRLRSLRDHPRPQAIVATALRRADDRPLGALGADQLRRAATDALAVLEWISITFGIEPSGAR